MIVTKNSTNKSMGVSGGLYSDLTYGHSDDVLFQESKLIYVIPVIFILIMFFKNNKGK